MNKIKFREILAILIIILMMFSLSVYAKVTLDETKMYLKTMPLDYITGGKDCTYDNWIYKYEQKRRNYKIGTTSVKTKAIIVNIKEDHIEYNPQ
ncbi:MAG: hypothetical protein U9N03_03190 [Candidatus Caldatribacteriota bacterium]|nr:hypothetical protein [Candidatus Caldatribacteriota bacterium]